MIRNILIILLIGCSVMVFSQERDSLQKTSYFGAPIIYYLPETSWGFGGVGSTSFNIKGSQTRSNIQLVAVYSLKKQIVFYIPFVLYLNKSIYSVEGELGYFNYLYPFYGLGNNTKINDLENYTTQFSRFSSSFYFKHRKIEYGFSVSSDYYFTLNSKEEGLLKNEVKNSKKGAVNSLGLLLRYDTRDSKYVPKKGFYVEYGIQSFNKYLGSNNRYTSSELDIRYYKSTKRITFANQLIMTLNGNDVHFNKMAGLGGAKRLRGIKLNRFRDQMALILQSEVRFPIWKKLTGVAFISEGVVSHNVYGLFQNQYHVSGGLGLRYTIDKSTGLNFRLDYAVSKDDSGVYITIGEAL